MADLLGVACNTYSKWERGYQPRRRSPAAPSNCCSMTLRQQGATSKAKSHAMALLARFTRDAGRVRPTPELSTERSEVMNEDPWHDKNGELEGS